MESNFCKVYSAVIITNGDFCYVKDNGKFSYLEGVEVDGMSVDEQPKQKILLKVSSVVGFRFSDEYIKYIGISIHSDEVCPIGCHINHFAVIHYWIDVASFFPHSDDYDPFLKDGFFKVHISDISNNVNNKFLNTDSMAAAKLISIKKKYGNDSTGILSRS